MILLKRSLTSFVLFIFLFFFAFLGIRVVGGAIAGAKAGAKSSNPQESFELGQQAGKNFVKQNLPAIVMSSLGVSLVASLALSFSGAFPWCRKPAQPPRIS
jgi:hypothetical protein